MPLHRPGAGPEHGKADPPQTCPHGAPRGTMEKADLTSASSRQPVQACAHPFRTLEQAWPDPASGGCLSAPCPRV